jgi:hypothetical protein
MVKDLLDAVAYTQKNMGDCDQQQFFQFGSETSSKLETNVDFINLLQDAMVNDRNSFYNLEGNMPRIPMVVDTLLNNSNKTSLVLLPDFVSFRRLEEILPQEALQDGRILLLDRFYNYICDEYLDSRIDELVKEKQATGFEFYLSLLLCKGKQILRNYIAPFLLYRQPVGQHLLDVAAESRWECSVNGCERRNCILGNLEENIEKAQVVITSASNLFVMEKLDKLMCLNRNESSWMAWNF